MKEIKRDSYLQKLVKRRFNGMVKIVTGIRRCGKSYLLFKLFTNRLLENGVPQDHIISVVLDDLENEQLLEVHALYNFVKSKIIDSGQYYLLLDEIQNVPNFEKALNSFLHIDNLDVYVTGSNSKFLSSDIITEFRGRGDQIKLYPLSFREFYDFAGKSYAEALHEYSRFGGMPAIALMDTEEEKKNYLEALFDNVYINDVVERGKIQQKSDLDELVNIIASVTGSITNARKIADTFKSVKQSSCSYSTISRYIALLQDAFMISEASRYDIKGRKHIDAGHKYYFTDTGLRNSRLNFRHDDFGCVMENLIYNELKIRGFSVDVGELTTRETGTDGVRDTKRLEVDFVAEQQEQRCYIQSCFEMHRDEKRIQELRSLNKISDSFRKIIIRQDIAFSAPDNDGIWHLRLEDFLLNENCLN